LSSLFSLEKINPIHSFWCHHPVDNSILKARNHLNQRDFFLSYRIAVIHTQMKNVLHQLWGNWCHVYKIYWVCQWEKYSVSRPRLFSLDNQDYDSSFSEKPSEEWCTQTSLCLCMLVTQWCLTLCDPMDCSLPGSSIHGILQAKILEWLAIPFPRSSSWWRDPIRVSSTVGWRFFFFFFYSSHF